MSNNDQDFPLQVESIEMAEEALSDAKAALDEKDEKISDIQDAKAELEEKAGAYRQIASAHGFDPESADVNDVVDRHTEDMRTEVAELEKALAEYSTEDIEARAEELQGKSPQYLEARAGDLARQKLRTQNEQDTRSQAIVAGHEAQAGQQKTPGTGGMTNEERIEEMADGVLDFQQAAQAKQRGVSPSQYIKAEYDVEASEFNSEMALREKIRQVRRNGGGD